MKILIAEDDKTSRTMLTHTLGKFGYDVISACDGKEALKKLQEADAPKLAILDWMMPEMDGVEVCRSIRTLETDRPPYVIMLTTKLEKEDIVAGLEAGADDYLAKPYDPAELRARVEVGCRIVEMQAQLVAKISELDSLYQQLHRNYEVASKVFSNIVRKDYRDRTDVQYLISPQEIVSGDLLLVSPKSPGGLYAFLGDFTGHGLSAAIGAIPASEIFYAMTAKNASIPDIVSEMNNRLKAVLPIGMFCCACVMELDHSSGRLTVWNGGMPDMLVVGRQGDIKYRLPFHAPALGVVGSDELDLDVEIIELAPKDRVYAYSDGITETANPDGEMFGRQRLEECLVQEYAHDNIFDEISSNLGAFRKDAPQSDDITMVEVTYEL